MMPIALDIIEGGTLPAICHCWIGTMCKQISDHLNMATRSSKMKRSAFVIVTLRRICPIGDKPMNILDASLRGSLTEVGYNICLIER